MVVGCLAGGFPPNGLPAGLHKADNARTLRLAHKAIGGDMKKLPDDDSADWWKGAVDEDEDDEDDL